MYQRRQKNLIPPNEKIRAIIAAAFFSFSSSLIFAHVEVPFVFGIINDYSVYSKKYFLSLNFVKSLFLFDVIVLFPFLFISALVFLYIENSFAVSTANYKTLASFVTALLYSLLFVLELYSSNFPSNKLVLFCIFTISISVCYFYFKKFFCENIFLCFIFANLLITVSYFCLQYIDCYYIVLGYAALFFAILFLLSSMQKSSRIPKYTLLIVLVLLTFEWSVLLSLSDESFSALPKVKNTSKRPNVIIIVLDTFRADYCATSEQANFKFKTPYIASFAKDAEVYKNCISPSSWTLPAHASIFTGLYPTSHGAHFYARHTRGKTINEDIYYPLSKKNNTLAEVLRKNGYKAYGVVSNYGFLNRSTGIAQGFEFYDQRNIRPFYRTPLAESLLFLSSLSPVKKIMEISGFFECRLQYQYRSKRYRLAEDINKSVRKVLKKHLLKDSSVPFFMFINYMDTHAPYTPVKKYRGNVEHKWLGKLYASGTKDLMLGKRSLTSEEKRRIRSLYKGEVMYADAQIGNLFEYLKNIGVYENSMIVFTSDHGEFLGEHNLIDHSCGLYQEGIAVPLVVKYPKKYKSVGTSYQPVQLVDIMPTILQFLKIKTPFSFEGYPLKTDNITPRKIVSEQYENIRTVSKYGKRFAGIKRSLILYPYKYIYSSIGKNELFDLEKDPKESRNILNEKKEIAVSMKDALKTWVSQRKKITKNKKNIIGKDEVARLKSLGYL